MQREQPIQEHLSRACSLPGPLSQAALAGAYRLTLRTRGLRWTTHTFRNKGIDSIRSRSTTKCRRPLRHPYIDHYRPLLSPLLNQNPVAPVMPAPLVYQPLR
jgi:hypothetical protein